MVNLKNQKTTVKKSIYSLYGNARPGNGHAMLIFPVFAGDRPGNHRRRDRARVFFGFRRKIRDLRGYRHVIRGGSLVWMLITLIITPLTRKILKPPICDPPLSPTIKNNTTLFTHPHQAIAPTCFNHTNPLFSYTPP